MLAQGVLQLDETQDELVDGPDQRAVVASNPRFNTVQIEKFLP
jgi:hypothetical protein